MATEVKSAASSRTVAFQHPWSRSWRKTGRVQQKEREHAGNLAGRVSGHYWPDSDDNEGKEDDSPAPVPAAG